MINNDELLYVVNQYDVPVAPKTRAETHGNGFWHRAAHVWITNSKMQLLCQKRSLRKKDSGGLWEPCVGGHINWSDDYFTGAVKEVREETGLPVNKDDLKLVKIYQEHEFREFRAVFHCVHITNEKIVPEEAEVDEVKWVDLKRFKKYVLTGEAKDWMMTGYEKEILPILLGE